MKILSHAFSSLGTNCYIICGNIGEIIIDPGIGASEWVKQNAPHALAIFNTHGHFDHVFSDAELKDALNCPIYLPAGDKIFVQNDPFKMLEKPFEPDFLVQDGDEFEFGDIKIKFLRLSGHTPGGGALICGNFMFSGDVVFNGSIGRTDFELGSAGKMRLSIQKLLKMPNFELFPGHGAKSSLDAERENLRRILEIL